MSSVHVPTQEELYGLASTVLTNARIKNVCLACAESCTGGLLGATLTEVSGSSDVFVGGIISYTIQVKHELLNVDMSILNNPDLGPVSKECALQMAQGAQNALRAQCAVSITGIAGPTGAEPKKPVGTVWFGIATPIDEICDLKHFAGTRTEVRLQAVEHALKLLNDHIMKI